MGKSSKNVNYLKKLLLLILLFNLSYTSFSRQSDDNEDYRNSLDKVIAHTSRMLKTSNKRAVAEWVKNVVDDRLLNSNSEEIFTAGSPFNSITAPLKYINRSRMLKEMRNLEEYDEYDGMAKLAWLNELGNCGENSYVTYYILKKAGAEGHVRILESGESGAHSFTVWGMPPDAMINDPTTWGDGLVVDPWLGKVLDRNEAMENKWIKNNDPDVPIRDATADHDTEAETWNSIWRAEMKRTGKKIPRNSSANNELEDCFIATAVFGTPTNVKIEILRTFRDQTLRKIFLGRVFISTYETFGPIAAYYIRGNEERKLWARKNIVEPALKIAEKNQYKK